MTAHQDAHRIINEARGWIGTPYIHQASAKGQGADCLGLIRGVWCEVFGEEPEKTPAYSSDWGEVDGEETMLKAAKRHFIPLATDDLCPGDMVIFRWKQMVIAKHAGIITSDRHFIHAFERTGVVETTLGNQWRMRIAAGFRFPEIPQKSQS